MNIKDNQLKPHIIYITLTALSVAFIGVFAYFLPIIEKMPEVTLNINSVGLTQNETPVSRNAETKITYSGEWKWAQFPPSEIYYYHSINIMLPNTWKFECCGDTGGYSAHYIYPISSEEYKETSPGITIYDFGLFGCDAGGPESCAINELKRITPDQYMKNLISYFDRTGKIVDMRSLKKTGVAKLSNFYKIADVYTGVSRSGQSVDLYIIQSSKGVIGVAFEQPQRFDSNFMIEFLNRITTN